MSDIQPTEFQRSAIGFVGLTLFAVQHCERVLGGCLTYVFMRGLTAEEFLRMDERHHKETLGGLERKLREHVQLPPDFAAQLRTFIEHRNRFIHRLFHEPAFALKHDTSCGLAVQFMACLLAEAESLNDVLSSALASALHAEGRTLPEELLDLINKPSRFPRLFHDPPKQKPKGRSV